jgi:shikimate kinase
MDYRRIYLIGFMGAGKTTVGRLLARSLGWTFIDLDHEIESTEKRAIADIFRQNGEPYFRAIERKCLQNVTSMERTVIALGGGTFIDPENRALLEKTGRTVWLKVSFAKVAHRVKIDGTRPKFGDPEQVRRLYEIREPSYALAHVHISTDEGTPDVIVTELMRVLQKS